MKYFIVGLLIATTVILLCYFTQPSRKPDAETKRLCMEYALRDHEKEFAPERWEYLKTIGNPNDVEFWYKSCINHHAYPVGGKENEWVR